MDRNDFSSKEAFENYKKTAIDLLKKNKLREFDEYSRNMRSSQKSNDRITVNYIPMSSTPNRCSGSF